MHPVDEHELLLTRRHFCGRAGGIGLGTVALASLLGEELAGATPGGRGVPESRRSSGAGLPHFAAKARRVIFLCQSGAPSQIDLFDPKPHLVDRQGEDLPESVRMGQRLTGMTADQDRFPVASSLFRFARHGQSGAWLSELLPFTAEVADDLCFIRSMHTEAINHDPAITFIQTGAQLAGRPSMGSWLSYGLGSENRDLPAFVTMVSGSGGQPLYDRLWGSGFLPTKHQGVKFRGSGDRVLSLSNPPGIDASTRRQMLDELARLNQIKLAQSGDPEIATRIAQYEMAYRMQTSVPELTDLSGEPRHILEMYGPDVEKPGTFTSNCLLARRLAERGVRFIQLYHRGWDHHRYLPKELRRLCGETDQATAALVKDLKQRALLDETLLVWGGEFGRTIYCQGRLTKEDYGRDHHPRCFTVWLSGAGIKPGITYGKTDDYCYNIVENPVHVHDLHATMLHCLGIDHKRLTFQYQGRHHRLTDVHGNIVEELLV